MSAYFDVVIVGAGPAGLRCAELLSRTSLSVVVLEKKKKVGKKVCAGGITAKGKSLLDIPPGIYEKAIRKARFVSPHFSCDAVSEHPIVYMVNREELGQWQLSLLKSSRVEVRTSAKVTAVCRDHVEINAKDSIKYKYLVGADGAVSVVRKFLNISVEKGLVTVEYRIPGKTSDRIEIHLDSRYFGAWYGWVFPHRNELAVGCCADPKYYPPGKMKEGFRLWLNKYGLDDPLASYESFPINYDYRGYRFGNRFLVGDAAGLASGVTGEGIFQALLSGQEVAKSIANARYRSKPMEALLRNKRIQSAMLSFLVKSGHFRNLVFDFIMIMMHVKPVNRYLTRRFSGY